MPRALSHAEGADDQLPANAPRDAVLIQFGRTVQRLMIERGWNQSELARRAQMRMPNGQRFGRDSVSRYIRGHSFPSPGHRMALAQAFDVDPNDLLPNQLRVSPGERMLPAFELKDAGDGMAWLRVNQAVPFDVAIKVASLIKGTER